MAKTTYKRILLKVSGEVLAGDQSFGIEMVNLEATARQIVDAEHVHLSEQRAQIFMQQLTRRFQHVQGLLSDRLRRHQP